MRVAQNYLAIGTRRAERSSRVKIRLAEASCSIGLPLRECDS
jgi:hypothetical protein